MAKSRRPKKRVRAVAIGHRPVVSQVAQIHIEAPDLTEEAQAMIARDIEDHLMRQVSRAMNADTETVSIDHIRPVGEAISRALANVGTSMNGLSAALGRLGGAASAARPSMEEFVERQREAVARSMRVPPDLLGSAAPAMPSAPPQRKKAEPPMQPGAPAPRRRPLRLDE